VLVIDDLKHPSIYARFQEQIDEMLGRPPENKPKDLSAIKRIIIKGSREEGEKRVLDCLSKMIRRLDENDLMRRTDFRDLAKFGLLYEFKELMKDGYWTAEKELTKAIAEKLDKFLRLLKYLPELRGYFPEIDQEEAKALDDLFAERVQKAKKRLNEKKE